MSQWSNNPKLAKLAEFYAKEAADPSQFSDDEFMRNINEAFWTTNIQCFVDEAFAIVAPGCARRPHLIRRLIDAPILAMVYMDFSDTQRIIAWGVMCGTAKREERVYVEPTEEGKRWLTTEWPKLGPVIQEVYSEYWNEITPAEAKEIKAIRGWMTSLGISDAVSREFAIAWFPGDDYREESRHPGLAKKLATLNDPKADSTGVRVKLWQQGFVVIEAMSGTLTLVDIREPGMPIYVAEIGSPDEIPSRDSMSVVSDTLENYVTFNQSYAWEQKWKPFLEWARSVGLPELNAQRFANAVFGRGRCFDEPYFDLARLASLNDSVANPQGAWKQLLQEGFLIVDNSGYQLILVAVREQNMGVYTTKLTLAQTGSFREGLKQIHQSLFDYLDTLERPQSLPNRGTVSEEEYRAIFVYVVPLIAALIVVSLGSKPVEERLFAGTLIFGGAFVLFHVLGRLIFRKPTN